jgi:hypothetical protein
MPACTDNGGYSVQPPAAAPPGTKKDPTSISAAGGRSQKLQLFIRAKAMSGAPIISGTCQLAKPTAAGMIAPKIMMRPCSVVSELKNSGWTICRPGWTARRGWSAHAAANEEHSQREQQVQRADVLVVGRGDPAHDPGGGWP